MNHKAFFKKHGESRVNIAGPDKTKNKKGKVSQLVHTTTVEELYEAFKSRLMDESSLLACNCAESKKKVKRPGGWVCPAHGSMTLL